MMDTDALLDTILLEKRGVVRGPFGLPVVRKLFKMAYDLGYAEANYDYDEAYNDGYGEGVADTQAGEEA